MSRGHNVRDVIRINCVIDFVTQDFILVALKLKLSIALKTIHSSFTR